MPVLKDRTDAILYLLDYMVGIDNRLDSNESSLLIQTSFDLLGGEFKEVKEKILWMAKLRREHDRQELFEEACTQLSEHGKLEEDLKLLRQMAAADGYIDPAEQDLFEKICDRLGVPSETLQA